MLRCKAVVIYNLTGHKAGEFLLGKAYNLDTDPRIKRTNLIIIITMLLTLIPSWTDTLNNILTLNWAQKTPVVIIQDSI